MALWNLGRKAAREGDFRGAEGLYRKIMKDSPLQRSGLLLIDLADAVDKQGRLQEALELYNEAYGPRWYGVGGFGDDRPLVRYGDLCAEFERTKDAFDVYAAVTRQFDKTHAPYEPPLTPKKGTLSAFRTAAYTALAWYGTYGTGADDARRYAKIAMDTDPQAWPIRYFLAQWSHGDEASRLADEAYRLAPKADRWYVERLRSLHGLPSDATTDHP